MSEPTTQAGMRVLNYHRSYKTQCGVHEDEMAPIVAEAEIEAATLARARADKAEAALAANREKYERNNALRLDAEAALAVADAASMDDAAAIQELGRDLLAARKDAEALAESLIRVRRVADDCWCGSNRLLIHTDDCLAARAALAAHRKATK